MECLKCGRETNQTFCDQCRESMKDYPVKQGLVIQLPVRQEEPTKKSSHRKKELSLEEQILRLKRRIQHQRWWITFLVLLLMASICTGVFLYHKGKERPIGQNYSTATQPTTETVG